ncbi:MAG: CoA-binding protein [Maribacter sp.]|nr:CoA-binding protein [Maribacter sp.]
MKKTLVFGASTNLGRYSSLAIYRLVANKIPTQAFGINSGTVHGVQIKTNLDDFKNIHTITLYLNPKKQKAYYNDIVKLRPKRVIFNPGTENPEFYTLLSEYNIEIEVACTLVLLSLGQY